MATTPQTATAWDVVHRLYSAYEANDRELAESLIADDFAFSSPPDPDLDRTQYFIRCWPNSKMIRRFRFLKVLEENDDVFVTYELEKTDGTRGRNTEFFVVQDGKIAKTDVYFGPSL